MNILTFDEAITQSNNFSRRHLLLGNGFSISCRPNIFHYGSLFKQADFTGYPNIPHVFEALGTEDFEKAINSLETGSLLAPIYSGALDDVPE